MWKWIATFLLLLIGALASGAPQYLHQLDHQREEAREARVAAAHRASDPPSHHEHSEADCPLCAQFHSPLFSQNANIHIFLPGDWLPFLTLMPVHQRPAPPPEVLSCRGPPAISCASV